MIGYPLILKIIYWSSWYYLLLWPEESSFFFRQTRELGKHGCMLELVDGGGNCHPLLSLWLMPTLILHGPVSLFNVFPALWIWLSWSPSCSILSNLGVGELPVAALHRSAGWDIFPFQFIRFVWKICVSGSRVRRAHFFIDIVPLWCILVSSISSTTIRPVFLYIYSSYLILGSYNLCYIHMLNFAEIASFKLFTSIGFR
jgi:hypothetical protein